MDSTNVIKVDLTDSNDVPTTGGDGTFLSTETEANRQEPEIIPTKEPEQLPMTPEVKVEKVYNDESKNDIIPTTNNSMKKTKKTDKEILLARKKMYSDLSIELGSTPDINVLNKSISTINKAIITLRNIKESQNKKKSN
jgi:hypothetical protein